jgi:hypothetical protein
MFFTWKIDRQPYYNQVRQKIKIPTEVGLEGIIVVRAQMARLLLVTAPAK